MEEDEDCAWHEGHIRWARGVKRIPIRIFLLSRHTSPAPFFAFCCFVLYAVISVVVEGVTTHEPPPRPTS